MFDSILFYFEIWFGNEWMLAVIMEEIKDLFVSCRSVKQEDHIENSEMVACFQFIFKEFTIKSTKKWLITNYINFILWLYRLLNVYNTLYLKWLAFHLILWISNPTLKNLVLMQSCLEYFLSLIFWCISNILINI